MKERTTTILHVTGTLNRGGAETFIMNILRNIDRKKYRFVIVCYGNNRFDYEDEATMLGAKVLRMPDVKDVGIRRHIKQLKDTMRAERVDIMHAHTYYNAVYSIVAASLLGINMRVAHSHTTQSELNPSILKKLYFYISKILINMFATDRIACGEEAGRAYFTKDFVIVNNGIDSTDFAYSQKERVSTRKELNISSKSKILLHVGRFEQVKNHAFLIDVFKEYRKINPDSYLLLVGEGSLRSDIENKVKKLGLKKKVIFLGGRSDVSRICSAADIFIFPSLFEGIPLALIEAQANGLPLVVSSGVDHEVKFSKDLVFLPLAEGAELWSKKISQTPVRSLDNSKLQENKIYDIRNTVAILERIYRKTSREYNDD